jgi:hypothetical protein
MQGRPLYLEKDPSIIRETLFTLIFFPNTRLLTPNYALDRLVFVMVI